MRFVSTILTALSFFALHGGAAAQEVSFQWKKGQAFQFQRQQTTRSVSITPDGRSETTSSTTQTKNWQVLDVDAAGVATLQLSISQMKTSQRLPDGTTRSFDSAAPEGSDPQLRNNLSELIGKPLAWLRVDATGKIVEVKLSQGPVSRFESELPFAVTLPGAQAAAGKTWTRPYNLILDPPLGAGEKFAAEQTCQVKSAAGGKVVIAFANRIKNPPAEALEQIPLLQFQPQGEVAFDLQKRMVTEITVRSGGKIEGHVGDGSSYEFTSEYREKLAP